MLFLRSLLAAVALVLMVASNSAIEANEDMGTYCNRLHNILATRRDLYQDAEASMEFATSILNSMRRLNVESPRVRLAKAWKSVVLNAPCSASSLDHISIIAQCDPNTYPSMKKTLAEPTKIYTKKCATVELIDEKVGSICAGHFGGGICDFMNNSFIEYYRALAPTEQLNLSPIVGDNCCQSHRATGSIFKAIEGEFAKKYENFDVYLLENPEALSAYMKSNLFDACATYLRASNGLMQTLAGVGKFYEGGERDMIRSLGTQSRDAIFRYKLCSNMQDETIQTNLLNAIDEKLKLAPAKTSA